MPSIVITGASSGIGAAAAHDLAQHGFQIFAGVRKIADGEALQAISPTITPILLDVTDPASIATAADSVRSKVGHAGLDGLVNNAGIAVMAPLEFIPLADLRQQLEINTIGQVAVTQAFLPLLRQAQGRIVNISSLSGTLTFPFMGAYAASKFGLEAITDALRQELYPWGIQVISIQPGSVATPIWQKGEDAARHRIAQFPAEAQSLYGKPLQRMERVMQRSAQRGMAVEEITAIIHQALTARRPKTRYFIVKGGWQSQLLRRLPDRWRDAILRRVMGLYK